MAQLLPCVVCGEQVNAQFLVTNTGGEEWLGYPITTACCVGCFIRMGERLDEALTEAMDEHPSAEPEGPGVLEQVEAEEGPQPMTAERRRSRRRKSAGPEANGEAVPKEAPTADVDR